MTETAPKDRVELRRLNLLNAAALRSMANRSDLHVRGGSAYAGDKRLPFYSPHLIVPPQETSLAARARHDAWTMRILLSDLDWHVANQPESPFIAGIVEWLEQLRCEALVPEHWPGMRRSVRDGFIHWAERFYEQGEAESAVPLLLLSVSCLIWAHFQRTTIPETLAEPLEVTRAGIAPVMGHLVKALGQNREDQQAYHAHAMALAEQIQRWIEDMPGANDMNAMDKQQNEEALVRKMFNRQRNQSEIRAVHVGGHYWQSTAQHYQVFSDKFDQEKQAAQLARPAVIRGLSQEARALLTQTPLNRFKINQRIRQVLVHPERDGWDFGLEHGYLDGRRLSQLLCSPKERRVFKRVAEPLKPNCALTILLDCSGSMKQVSSSMIPLIQNLGLALSRWGIPIEVLGFTTAAWHGGKAVKAWRAAGEPANPGRLNERLHIVFKSASAGKQALLPGLSLLLRQDLFRESLDGEAVLWAAQRSAQSDVTRRLLLVVSDGCPMDTATENANAPHYLDNHLQTAVAQVEQQGEVEIAALGVGLDLSPFYRRHVAMDFSQGLTTEMVLKLIDLWRPGRQ